ncbi:hypothetical protein M407DRAFT_22468, partial [Tulasnella calospora MUT 4182]
MVKRGQISNSTVSESERPFWELLPSRPSKFLPPRPFPPITTTAGGTTTTKHSAQRLLPDVAMIRLGARSGGQGKRERPTSQERELESRPAKRPNLDDDPEEGELEDDNPPPATASQQTGSSSSSLPPRPANLPLPPRPAVGSSGSASSSKAAAADPSHPDARGSENAKKLSGVKTVAFPFKMKPKAAQQPAQAAEPSRT